MLGHVFTLTLLLHHKDKVNKHTVLLILCKVQWLVLPFESQSNQGIGYFI